jgi:hypothetical protein
MKGGQQSIDEQTVRELDRSWNEVYLRNDRSGFATILANDFQATFSDGRTAGKVDLMRPTPEGAKVSFSEFGIQMYPPTAMTCGRVRIEHSDQDGGSAICARLLKGRQVLEGSGRVCLPRC